MQISVTKTFIRPPLHGCSLDRDKFTLTDDSTRFHFSSVQIGFDSKCWARVIDEQLQPTAMNEAAMNDDEVPPQHTFLT